MKLRKKTALALIAALVLLLALSACGGSSVTVEGDAPKYDLPDRFVGTWVFYDYKDADGKSLSSPQKDADKEEILEFTITDDGVLTVNGKTIKGCYEGDEAGDFITEDKLYTVIVNTEPAGEADEDWPEITAVIFVGKGNQKTTEAIYIPAE